MFHHVLCNRDKSLLYRHFPFQSIYFDDATPGGMHDTKEVSGIIDNNDSSVISNNEVVSIIPNAT